MAERGEILRIATGDGLGKDEARRVVDSSLWPMGKMGLIGYGEGALAGSVTDGFGVHVVDLEVEPLDTELVLEPDPLDLDLEDLDDQPFDLDGPAVKPAPYDLDVVLGFQGAVDPSLIRTEAAEYTGGISPYM